MPAQPQGLSADDAFRDVRDACEEAPFSMKKHKELQVSLGFLHSIVQTWQHPETQAFLKTRQEAQEKEKAAAGGTKSDQGDSEGGGGESESASSDSEASSESKSKGSSRQEEKGANGQATAG